MMRALLSEKMRAAKVWRNVISLGWRNCHVPRDSLGLRLRSGGTEVVETYSPAPFSLSDVEGPAP
ncbi:MAG: hypothetical protein ACTMKV_03885, partial [Sphingomonas parapaucimobilis]